MTYGKKLLAAAAVLSVALAACGGGGSNSLPSTASARVAPTPYSGPQSLSSFTWGASTLQGAAYLGPAHFGSLGINVVVSMQNLPGLLSYAREVSDKTSASYRQFLTPAEIGNRFGASAQDYAKTAQYFASNGLHVGGWPQREVLFVAGPQAALEKAFGTTFGLYEKNGVKFVAPVGTPHLQQALPMTAVSGLIQLPRLRTYLVPGRSGNNNFLGYSPQQVQKVFDYAGAYQAGYDGTGITVGIIGTGPISAADVPNYGKIFSARVATVNEVPATDSGLSQSGIPTPNPSPSASPQPPYAYSDFGLATPPPVTSPCNQTNQYASVFPTATCNPEDGEAQLDTEQVASLAPGSTVNFYLAFNPTDCSGAYASLCNAYVPNSIGIQGLWIADDEIQQAIADNRADILSLSYGGGEADNIGGWYDNSGMGFGPMEFATLATEGVAVFVSSGDYGAEECTYVSGPCVAYPAGDPNVTSVGGVTVPMDTWGNLTSQLTAWGYQTAGGFSGSGGGVSTVFAAPSWQHNAISATMRQQPDVSLLADPATGVGVLMNSFDSSNISLQPIGGTSVAAPEMAAMWALVLQACKAAPSCSTGPTAHPYRLGNAAPLLYPIYSNAATYASTFFDVIYGDTAQVSGTPGSPPPLIPGCCQAGKGYDNATGIGVPFVGHLITAITGKAVP